MPAPTDSANPVPADAFSPWEGAVRLELFSERVQPTLSVPEQIAAELAKRILGSKLAPGERIAEQQVADEFQVSRGPVREAIRLLEREGLATVLPRRGAVVTELSAHEVAELFEIRTALFALVVKKITKAAPPELLLSLRAGIARLESLADEPGGGGCLRRNRLQAADCGGTCLRQPATAADAQCFVLTDPALQQAWAGQRSASA